MTFSEFQRVEQLVIKRGASRKPPEARLKGSERLGDQTTLDPACTLIWSATPPFWNFAEQECKTVTALILILYPACLSNLSLLTGSGHSLEALAYSVPTLPDTVIKPFFLSRLWLCLHIFVWHWSKESIFWQHLHPPPPIPTSEQLHLDGINVMLLSQTQYLKIPWLEFFLARALSLSPPGYSGPEPLWLMCSELWFSL